VKHLLFAALFALVLSSLAFASPPSVLPSPPEQGLPGDGEATGPAVSGDPGAPGQAEYRIPINGCSAMVDCPGGGFVRCVSWYSYGCVEQPAGDPPWVACDGVVKYCPW
jgi:hypothetical protein